MVEDEKETISTELQLTDLRKQSFQRTLDYLHDHASSILLLTLHWKDIEDHLDSTRNSIDERIKELHSIQMSIEQKINQVKKRESDLQVFQETVELRVREVEKREEEFELIQKKEIEERTKEIDWIQKSGKELEFIRDQIEMKLRAVDEVELKFKLFNDCIEEKTDRVRDFYSKLKLKEDQLRLKEEEIVKKFKEIRLKEKQIEQKCRELEDFKENNVETHVKIVPKITATTPHNDANLYFTVNMDGKALQIFLNEHRGEYDSIKDEVFVALRFSSDPAKLVLDAMQGFYPPDLRKGDVEFKPEVVRRSCILLLEQLMRMSPEISPDVRNEATKLSFNWMTKMKVDAEHSLEVLGFLQLLASYGLASTFDADELFTQLEVIVQHRLAPGLFRALGFSDKISGIVRNLIGKKQYIEAIKVIYAFELVKEFPPVPLLKDYLQFSKNAAKSMRKADNSLKGLIETTNKRIFDLRCASSCIGDYNIEGVSSLGDLNKLIANLEKENSTRKAKLAVKEFQKYCSSRRNESRTRKRKPLPKTSTSVPITKTQSQQLSGNKRPLTDASAKSVLNASHGADQATCSVPLDVKLEQSSPRDLTLESNKVPPTCKPSSSAAPNGQRQQQSENKRARNHNPLQDAKEVPIKLVGATSEGLVMQPLGQHPPPGLCASRGVPYIYAPPRHYNLGGYPPQNMQFNSSNANVTSSYHWTTFGNSSHNWVAPF